MRRTLPATGFALLELVLYIVIVSSLLGGLSTFFGMTAEARLRNQAVSEVTIQGQIAMETIALSIRSATSVTTPTIGTSGNALNLVVPTASLSPTQVAADASGNLVIKEGASGAVIALTNTKVQVSNLSFKNLSRATSKGTLQVSFTLSRVNTGNRAELDYNRTFTTTIGLRP